MCQIWFLGPISAVAIKALSFTGADAVAVAFFKLSVPASAKFAGVFEAERLFKFNEGYLHVGSVDEAVHKLDALA